MENINEDTKDSLELESNGSIKLESIESPSKKYIIKRILYILLGIFLIIFILGIIVYRMTPEDRAADNVFCSGINMSGKTYDEIRSSLSSNLKLDTDTISIDIPIDDESSYRYNIFADDIEMKGIVDATANEVVKYAHSGKIIDDTLKRAMLVFKRHDIKSSVEFNEDKLAMQLDTIGKEALGQIVPHKIVPQADGNVALVPGKEGFDENVKPAIDDIKKALNKHKYSDINVRMSLGQPERLKFENVDGAVYCDPTDAYYQKDGNTVSVIPEKAGRFLVKEECEKYIDEFNKNHTETVFPYHVSNAEKTADDLNKKLFSTTLGSYSTSYGGGNRGTNVANAASKLNGTIVLPDEVFSFNDTVGPRNTKNGFKEAPEYANGQSVMGIGGGTCQVSSTLYVATLYSGLQIVSRLNHSMAVGYMPSGLDATVSYGGVDFKFKNDTEYPIKIVTSASPNGGLININIIGTAYDPPLTFKLTSSGTSQKAGKTYVTNYREVYDESGNKIRTDKLGTSIYNPHS